MADRISPANRFAIAAEPFGAPDSEALRAELARELAHRYGVDSEPGAKPTGDDVAVFLMARDVRGTPVGCGALRDLGGGAAEIKRMYVRPAARGCSLARRLLESLEAEARARGLTVCRLETGECQPEAIALYRRAGYREIEGFGVYAGMPLSRCFERRLEAPE